KFFHQFLLRCVKPFKRKSRKSRRKHSRRIPLGLLSANISCQSSNPLFLWPRLFCARESAGANGGRWIGARVLNPLRKALVHPAVLRQFRAVMADRRLGCLSIFFFVALCASLFINFMLAVAVFQRIGGMRETEPIPRFREILLQRGTRGTTDEIAVITMRGLISSSLPGSVTDSMVDDMRVALQQARDDDRVKAVVLEFDWRGGEVTEPVAIHSHRVE